MKYKWILFVISILILTTSCNNRELMDFSFNSSIEKPYTDEHNTKVHLVQEKWVYWDLGDKISVASEKSTEISEGILEKRAGGNDFNGAFRAMLPENSAEFLALFPHSNQNQISYSAGKFNAKIDFPAVQPWTSDTSFGINVAPMVAYCNGGYPYKMDFHSLFGLVRIQLSAKDLTQLSSIVFTEISPTPKQISGVFDIKEYKTYAPRVIETSPSNNNLVVTVDFSTKPVSIGSGSKDQFVSVYLVLPAVSESTLYKLQMKVVSKQGMECIKTMNVPIRRNGITYMQAIHIETWGDGTNNGIVSTSITGNGTIDRPFKIYTINDLKFVRQCFNEGSQSGVVKINNRVVGADTYFKLMRSDIKLTDQNWTTGIKKFTGKLIYAGSASSTPGITNNSKTPIFESISNNGVVSNLWVRGTYINTTDESKYYSPFCTDNNGKIINCMLASGSKISLASQLADVESVGVAGLCVNNRGKIEGSGVAGELGSQGHLVGGICLFNYDTIKGCYAISPMDAIEETRSAAGICYRNESDGVVMESYIAANINSGSSDWGGIVFENNGTIYKCFLDHAGIIKTTRTYGGVVNKMNGGLVDYCWNATDLAYGSTDNGSAYGGLGGIVNVMNGGEIRNSFCNIPTVTMTVYGANSYGGGIVANMNGGSIKNCYSRFNIVGYGTKGSFVGNMTGGVIENCYGWDDLATIPNFYGVKAESVNSTNNLKGCYYYNNGFGTTSQSQVTAFQTPAEIETLYDALTAWVTHSDYMTWNNAGPQAQPLLTGNYYSPQPPTP